MGDDIPTFARSAAGRPPPRSYVPLVPATGGAPVAGTALRVVAHLASPLAGDPPHLDSLLVYVSSRLGGKGAEPGHKIDRKHPVGPTDHIPIPVRRGRPAGAAVAYCSSPILPEPAAETVEYVCKRVAVEHAGMLAPGERKMVTTTNDWTKNYRLPLRVRRVACVVWLCVGNRREVLKLLKLVPGVGKKVADGYGRVSAWEAERLGDPPHPHWPWWVESEAGPVLMRPLPAGWEGLPPGLVGARADFGACNDPYWHPDRFRDVVSPC